MVLESSSVTFGPSSPLKRIGVEAFGSVSGFLGTTGPCKVVAISIPDSVVELCDRCFIGCLGLRCVKFGPLASLERMGVSCFAETPSKTCCSESLKPNPLQRRRGAKRHATKTLAPLEALITQLTNTVGNTNR